MAIWQANTDREPVPKMLTMRHCKRLRAFLERDPALNLFQLCWLENHGVLPDGRPELFHYAALPDGEGSFRAVSLAVTNRLALIDAIDERAARSMGRWYRQRGFVFDHIVSGDASVSPFWDAYVHHPGGTQVRARLNRLQKLLTIERDRWFDEILPARDDMLEPTGLERAKPPQLEAVYLASAQMHREETLEDPLESNPESFRRHVRHRIDSGRTFVWFNAIRQLMFKADISARGDVGVQLSGVFTPPPFRGRGVATRALFDICRELFEGGTPRVALYVNAENAAALRVYEKVGFDFHADFRTVFIESSGA
ncbi:MAG: GNAT family N-acetyltransferase [Myxococcota bacterium]